MGDSYESHPYPPLSDDLDGIKYRGSGVASRGERSAVYYRSPGMKTARHLMKEINT